jgi:hypothetical protein
LAGCVIPILRTGIVAGGRENLGEQVLDFIIPGVTTKEDVLMRLGEADNLWPESQLHYHTVIERGGVGVVFPPAVAGFHRQLWRTLIVEFDNAEFVTSAHLLTERCSVVLGARNQRPCVLVGKATNPGRRSKTVVPKVEQ